MAKIFDVLYQLACANIRIHWSKKQLKEYQNRKIRSLIKHANATVPFYRQQFKAHNIDIDSIKGVDDLYKLPILTKEKLKSLKPENVISTLYDFNRLKKVRTSGSTGKPLQICISEAEDAWRKAIYMRANINCGQKLRDRWVVITAPHHFGDTPPLQRKLGVFSQNCISLFESNTEKIKQIEKINPQILDGYSGTLLLLAKELKRSNNKAIHPRIVFGNAELIDSESQKYLEDVFGAPYCDQFGCAEVDRTAWQCIKRRGYHMDIDSVITEFTDKTGESVSAGERGEITYTSLFNYAMPLIRYQVGDVGVPSDDTCSCGNNLPMMKVVEGRKDSFLVLPNDRVVSPFAINLEASTFRYFSGLDQYHIRQRSRDLIDIYLKINDYSLDQQVVAEEFETLLREFLGIKNGEVELKTYFVDELKISGGGKLASITSEVPF
jgi:phenylacetate-CoA ligase